MTVVEANFDGLIGPTHNYAGLSHGNIASSTNAEMIANPKEGALQGLDKMRFVAGLGLVQGLLPPHERPHMPTLKALGFSGTDAEIIGRAAKEAPEVLRNCSSASTMWTANAATVSPSLDCADGKVHFTPANLNAMFHRSIEHPVTGRALKAIFADEQYFAHHPALPSTSQFGDEGAANHNRFCENYGDAGVELFVYGQQAFDKAAPKPKKFPARQSFEAGHAIARHHGLKPSQAVYMQQNPDAIDAGAFHNDVVAVSNKNTFFYHERAFENPADMQAKLWTAAPDIDFHFIEVPEEQVGLKDAIKSYMFNSQLISPADKDGMTLILPVEAQEINSTNDYLAWLVSSNHPVNDIHFMEVRQSMRNGGGPACLRLRVVLTEAERNSIKANVFMTANLYSTLKAWVNKHYRDRLVADDLADPELLVECRTALDELTGILGIGNIYNFQR
jgi:succinylarginine dihydrolase